MTVSLALRFSSITSDHAVLHSMDQPIGDRDYHRLLPLYGPVGPVVSCVRLFLQPLITI